MLLNVTLASDIRMIPGASAQDILGESRKVMESDGEWELADIGIAHSTLALDGGHFSEIKYFVRSFFPLDSVSIYHDTHTAPLLFLHCT